MKFLQEQFYVYEEKGSGWIFWCWKTESTLDWDMQRLNMLEMLPDPLFRFAHMNNEQNFTSLNINIDNNSSRKDSQFNVTEAKTTKTRTKNETTITDIELSVFEYFLITLLLFFRFW